MSMWDDVVYVTLLLVSIGTGWVLWLLFPERDQAAARRSTSTVLGLLVLCAVSGVHAAHCFVSVALQCLTMVAVPTDCVHVVSAVLQFAYLFFFRLGYLIGVPMAPAHTNAIQMILALKMAGLAFEVNDTVKWKKMLAKGEGGEETRRLVTFKGIDPSIMDIVHYAFSHIGLLTGPYYKFRTFSDLYEMKYSYLADCEQAMWKRISWVPLYVFLFLASGALFPLKAAEAEGFYETSTFLYRIFYMTPVFFNFRMRLYSGFILSECSCIMAGLGAYPKSTQPKSGNGPTNLEDQERIETKECHDNEKYDFETVHNIDEYGAETVSTMREGIRTWNTTVQYWLAVNVYRRFPIRSVRTVAVMVVSSMWHGVYSGYYLSLGSVPFIMAVEDLYERIMRRKLGPKGQVIFDWVAWFMRMQWFSYLGMAFQLLRADVTAQYWHSIYFIGHSILPVFYILGLIVVRPLLGSFRSNERSQ